MPVNTMPAFAHTRNNPTAAAPKNFDIDSFVDFPRLPGKDFNADINDLSEFPELPNSWVIPRDMSDIKKSRTYARVALHQPPGQKFQLYPNLIAELRELVIEKYMALGKHVHQHVDVEEMRVLSNNNATRPAMLPALGWASNSMLHEVVPVFLRLNIFTIRSINANEYFTRFIESIPANKGLLSVRALHFTSFHRYRGVQAVGANKDLQLMARCKGLTNLKLTWHVERVTKPIAAGSEDDDLDLECKTIEEIVKFYELWRFAACPDIKAIDFDGIRAGWVEDYCQGNPTERLKELTEWVRGIFKKKWGTEVRCEIIWRTHRHVPGS